MVTIEMRFWIGAWISNNHNQWKVRNKVTTSMLTYSEYRYNAGIVGILCMYVRI